MRNPSTVTPVVDNPPPRSRSFCPYSCSAARVSFCMCLDLLVHMFDVSEIVIISCDYILHRSILWFMKFFCSVPPQFYGSEEDLRCFDVEKKDTSQETREIQKVHTPDIFFDYGLTNPLRQSEQTKRSVCPRCYKVFRIVNDSSDDISNDSIIIGPHRCDGKAPRNLEFQLEKSRGIKESPLKLKIEREKAKRIQLELKRIGLDAHDSDDKNNNTGSSSPKIFATQQNSNLTDSLNAKQERTIRNWMASVESAKVDRLRTIKKHKPRPIIKVNNDIPPENIKVLFQSNNDPNLNSKIIQMNVKLQISNRRLKSKATLRQADVTRIRPVSCHGPQLNETVKVNTRRRSLDGLKTLQHLLDIDIATGSKDTNLEMNRLLLERDIANAVNDKLQLLQFQQMLDDNEYFASLARASKAVTFAVIHERKRIPDRIYKSGPVPVVYNSFSTVPTTRLPADYQRRHIIGAEDDRGQNSGLNNSLGSSVAISIPESIDSITSDDIDKMVSSFED